MDIVEYVEKTFGIELLEYQKIILRNTYELSDKNDIRIVMKPNNAREQFYTYLKQNNLPICKELIPNGKTLDSNN